MSFRAFCEVLLHEVDKVLPFWGMLDPPSLLVFSELVYCGPLLTLRVYHRHFRARYTIHHVGHRKRRYLHIGSDEIAAL